ncbi:PrsW family intramembrane metalloprotease [Patescibacteria group bacterium]|nr:PrsW family intramembrane metalloprotease [Patescibacteria group bacterium]MBU4353541.1 PrsW family intramembrane metalloprotease [Patescibacteria group bacterium]MBU4476844.1 PrsW family intramembrane metalloprotease [Patescibacteria group bacterium]MCG2699282.1 PrsW family glutamic-type intramembrane protease [Candidatus Parcubacteria bacterium]
MDPKITATTVFFIISGGILPALFWLWFWLKEDRHPEPRGVLLLTFFAGMAAVAAALPIEYLFSLFSSGTIMLLLWAAIEEILKYLAARETAFTKSSFDEPIDAIVYMITAALGFAALENIFFIFQSFSLDGPLLSFITGNLRFIGATLLHTATSAIIGASIAFSFFHKEKRIFNVIGGIMLAVILHFFFNYFIIKSSGANILKIFIPLWLGIIIIIFICEKIKRLKN